MGGMSIVLTPFRPEEPISRRKVNERLEAVRSALEAGETGLSTHTGNKNNPHNVTAKQIGAEKWELIGSASITIDGASGSSQWAYIPATGYAKEIKMAVEYKAFNLKARRISLHISNDHMEVMSINNSSDDSPALTASGEAHLYSDRIGMNYHDGNLESVEYRIAERNYNYDQLTIYSATKSRYEVNAGLYPYESLKKGSVTVTIKLYKRE